MVASKCRCHYCTVPLKCKDLIFKYTKSFSSHSSVIHYSGPDKHHQAKCFCHIHIGDLKKERKKGE